VADEQQLPTEEELREALDRIGVADILLNALSAGDCRAVVDIVQYITMYSNVKCNFSQSS